MALLLAACGSTPESAPSSASTPASTTGAPRPAEVSTTSLVWDESPATTTTGTNRPHVDGLLDQLILAPESHAVAYERRRFEHWIDADHDGCNTRCEVLAAERRRDLPGLSSGWLSIYDGYSTDIAAELEVDHVVALAEAWRSGAYSWSDERRRDFANDLVEHDALVAVTAAMNQSKGDRDPAEWQPPRREAWCQWALGWTRTKIKWGLSADKPEIDALRNILRDC